MAFDTVLVANRGEIACRVIETARDMGLRTVAVYSEADRAARHVALADTAVLIGGAAPAESYLNIAAVIEAARQSGAGAIHPGYGFLSENPEFVDAVEAAGLVFVGPSASAIRAMGLKDAAKAVMETAGVPVVPGYHGADQEPGRLEVEAADIGYPVLIKAVAGGGGKGMRKVATPEAFIDALESAKAEARTAFGNDAVLIEKFVEKPRHIEVQVFGDGARAVHLFERDCSLQRRHQKVIEEAPAPGMTEEMRAAMGAAAVRAAEAVGYAGAGTVEFIVDASDGLRPDRFWFMEMNTRLQVEHPVTEEITGVDLVAWQLRVAAGEPLPLEQDALSIRGHALEVRLYAEDVPAGFLPATGVLGHLRFPSAARIDTGVRPGDVISPHYDPMIAKITVHGPDRAAALRAMAHALDRTEIAGTVTNIGFLARLVSDADFAAGNVDTGLIERKLEALVRPVEPEPHDFAQAALISAGLWEMSDPMSGFSLWHPNVVTVPLKEAEMRLEVQGPDRAIVEVEGTPIACARGSDGVWRIGGRPARRWVRLGNEITLFGGAVTPLTCVDPLDRGSGPDMGGDAVLAPMPGRVTATFVAPGAAVSAGDRLVVLEAMKMEHALVAPRDGRIAEVPVAAEDQVDAGMVLVRLEAEEE